MTNSTKAGKLEQDSQLRDVHLATVQENSPDGILVVGEEGQIISFNQKFVDIWDIPSRVLASRSDEAVLQAMLGKIADPDSFIARVKYLYDHKKEKCHWEILLKDGRVLDRNSAPMFGHNDKYLGRIWYFRDITELKQTEAALRASEQQLKLAVASGQVGIWEYNLQTNELIWDDTMFALYGARREDFSGAYDAWATRLHPEDRAATEAALQDAIAGKRDYEPEFRVIWPDGEVHYIKGHAQVIRGHAGNPVRMIGTIWDNSAHAHTLQQLQLAHTAINTSKIAFLWLNSEGQVTDVNDYACQNLGYTREELIGQHVWDFDPNLSAESWPNTWAELKRSGERTFESLHRRKEGTILPVEITANIIVADGKEYSFSFARDITERKLTEDASRRHKVVIDTAREGFWVVDLKGNLLEANQAYADMSGYSIEELESMHVSQLEAIENPSDIQAHIAKILAQGYDLFETRHHRKDGAFIDVEVSVNYMAESQQFFAFFRDITERKKAEESLRLAASVYETSSEAMTITDADNRIIAINPAFTKITGYALEEVIGKNPSILSSGRHDETFYQAMWHDINTTGHWQGEIWDRRKNGEVYPKWLTINTVFNEDGTVQRRVAMFTDITQKREAEALIWHQANFDLLTGLPNRQMFHDRLDQDIKKSHRAGLPLALMFLDLDRFKEVNDTLGHDMGDLLLKEAAQRLSGCVRETDTVARLGGDEFTIILGELDDPGSVDRVARDILRKLSEPFRLGEEVAYVSTSIGITFYPEDATAIDTLLKNADQAMYAAKNQGRNRYSYFTPSMQRAAQSRMQIATDLRGALAGHQFWIAYQPIVELATGAIHKAEALLRWQHPTRGLVSPAEFIPIAEDTGLIVDIGDWVFREVAQQAKRWRASHHAEFQISVNKSPVQFRDEDSNYAVWPDQLQQFGLPGQSIVVEITEGLLLDTSSLVTDRLLEFRDAGMQVSLDDFGTGYSSLSYLKKFDIDYLKIDQSFTRNLASGSDDMALCEAIIVMAHKLGMQVIAEGVETEEQKALLTAAGCDYGQGYLFSRPIPANEFGELLQKKIQ